jgi:hypothetical protein
VESGKVREDESKRVAMLPYRGDGRGQRDLLVSLAESAAQAWESFARIALTSAGVCDRTLRPYFGRGAVPCPANSQLQSCPALRLLDWPVKCPLYARAIDIFGAALEAQQLLTLPLPRSQFLVNHSL